MHVVTDVRREGKPEVSRVEWVPIAGLRALIANGQINDGQSLTALSAYLVLA